MTTYALRISLLDRPGGLGAVTTALGQAGVNIVSLDVVESAEGMAVDHLLVEGKPNSSQDIIGVVESVPSAVVDYIRALSRDEDRREPLELAVDVVEAEKDPLRVLVDGVPGAFDATWCIAVRERSPQPEPLAASGLAPSLVGARLPWFPVEAPRRLAVGPWVPSRWSLDQRSASFAVAPLRTNNEALLVARTRGPGFQGAELGHLGHLARITAAVLAAETVS